MHYHVDTYNLLFNIVLQNILSVFIFILLSGHSKATIPVCLSSAGLLNDIGYFCSVILFKEKLVS